MVNLKSLTLLFLLGIQSGIASVRSLSAIANHVHIITKTWDSQDHPDGAEITVEFLAAEGREEEGFTLKVEAPFYDSPQLPPGTLPGRFDELWEYEVVEVFFLGPNEKYLEVELAPSDNYLVYYLEGIRNPTNTTVVIEYSATKTENEERWIGTAFIPWSIMPPCINKFNAYAIHKSNEDRIYMSLFPVPEGSEGPNFHNLAPFQDIDLSDLGLAAPDPKDCIEVVPASTEPPSTEPTTDDSGSESTTEDSGSVQLAGRMGLVVTLLVAVCSILLSIN